MGKPRPRFQLSPDGTNQCVLIQDLTFAAGRITPRPEAKTGHGFNAVSLYAQTGASGPAVHERHCPLWNRHRRGHCNETHRLSVRWHSWRRWPAAVATVAAP